MKKNSVKKSLALLLSLLLLLSCFSAALCASAQDLTPVIVVSGMGSFPLTLEEDGKETQVFAPETSAILAALKKCVVPLGKKVVKSDFSDLSEITSAVNELFDSISCKPDGTSKYPVQTKTFPKSVDNYPEIFENGEQTDDELGIVKGLIKRIGGENVWFFNYDWRLDPLEHADRLEKMIDSVRKEKNCERVTLIPASMGGCVVMSYLYKYGSDKLQRVVMAETAFRGVSLVGELFNKRLEVNSALLTEYFYTFYQSDNFLYQTLFALLSSAIDLGGVNGKATIDRFLAKVLETLKEPAYKDVLSKTFANMPGIWALVPNADYTSAKKAMFPDGMNKKLKSRADTYQKYVQKKAGTLIDSSMENGADFLFCASYGFVGFPCVSTSFGQTDCLIDTKYESFGAVCADRGTTLGKDYVPSGKVCSDEGHKHVSSDLVIDASACRYPEKTWFVKYNRHVGHALGTEANDLILFLALTEGEVDIYTDEKYPQFTALELFTGKLVSLTGDADEKDSSNAMSGIFSRLTVFIRGIIRYFFALFSK